MRYIWSFLIALAVVTVSALTAPVGHAVTCTTTNNGNPQTITWSGGKAPLAGSSFGDGGHANVGDGTNAGWIVVDLGCFNDQNGSAGNVFEREYGINPSGVVYIGTSAALMPTKPTALGNPNVSGWISVGGYGTSGGDNSCHDRNSFDIPDGINYKYIYFWSKGDGNFQADVCKLGVVPVSTPTPTPAPTVNLQANGLDGPITIAYNATASISWSSTNATTCTASGSGWSGAQATSQPLPPGLKKGPLTSSQTYTLMCTGGGGDSTPDSVMVNVSSPVITVTMTANPNSGIQSVASTLKADATSPDTTDTFNYSIWYDCNNPTTDVGTANSDTSCGNISNPPGGLIDGQCVETANVGIKCDGVSASTLSESVNHTYTPNGTYHAKVILEQDGAAHVESRATVTVTPDTAPSQPVVTLTTGDYCSSPGETISWTYADINNAPPGTDPESQYEVVVSTNPGFGSPFIDQTVPGNSTSYFATGLAFNTTYYVRVAVWDTLGNMKSAWSVSKNFTTPIHAYPQVGFTPPSNPRVNQSVTFTDTTTFDPASSGKIWAWLFCANGTECKFPSVPNTQNPVNTFYVKKNYTSPYVTLLATDDAGSCSITKSLNVSNQRLPGWREVSPK